MPHVRLSLILAVEILGLFLVSASGQASAANVIPTVGVSPLTWTRTYSAGSGFNNLVSVAQTRDAGYVAAGAEDGNLWVLRLNPTGHILWQKEYGGSDVTSVQQTSDGGFIVSSGGEVFKLNSQGVIVWQKFYNTGRTESIYSIEETSDGGYLAAGFTATTSPLAHGLILRLDASGNILWQKIFQGDNVDFFTSAQQTSDGGYVAVGSTNSFGDMLDYAWVVRLDPAGNVMWQKAYQDSGHAGANSVQQTSDGGFIVAADNHFLRQAWVFKLDTMGNVVWQKGYSWVFAFASAQAVVVTQDGGYAIAGYLGNFMLLVRLDSSGNQLWYRTFGGGNGDLAYALAATRDGGFVAAGDSFTYTTAISSGWVVKLNSDGICCQGIIYNISPTVETTTAIPIATNATIAGTNITTITTNYVAVDTSSVVLTQCQVQG